MKRNLARAAVLASLVLGIVVPSLAQQSRTIKVNVPFNFIVENDRMPAGAYTIQRIAAGRLLVRRDDSKSAVSVLALPTQAKAAGDETRIVFRRYGNEYFLYRIWTPGLEVGWEIFQGKLETELSNRRVPMQMASLVAH